MNESGDRVLELLRELEDEHDRQGSPFSECANPPVDPARLDEAERQLGYRFPDELRAWWLWHDGTEPRFGRMSDHVLGAGGFQPYSLTRALDEWDDWARRSIFRESAHGEWEFRESWLPFAGVDTFRRLNAKLELSTPDHLVLGVLSVPWDDAEFGHTVDLTFPDLIRSWIRYLREGNAVWDPAQHAWDYRFPFDPTFDTELH